MRGHIGKNMLNETAQSNANLCGVCGLVGCAVGISEKYGGKTSACSYFFKFSMKSVGNSRLLAQIVLFIAVWSYIYE